MPVTATIRITGLREMQRILRGNDLYAEPWRDGMKAIGQLGESVAATAAPVYTGLTERKISHAVQRAKVPLWIAIRSRARKVSAKYPRGYDYPRRLEYDARMHHLHWFTAPLYSVLISRLGPIMNGIKNRVEENWARQHP